MLLPTRQWIQVTRSVFAFYTAVVSFLVGVFLYSFFNFGIIAPALLLGGAIGAFSFLVVKQSHTAFALLAGFVFLAFGCLRVLSVEDVQKPFVALDGERVQVVGTVLEDPDMRDTSLHVVVRTHEIQGEAVSGTLLARLDRATEVSYGDTVSLHGVIELPHTFETATGKEFDYPGYLRAKGVGAVLLYPTLHVDTPAGGTFLGFLYSVKHALEHSIELTLPEPAAGLLEGILLGNKAALGDALYEMFIIAGLVHIVVLSGYNLTIVADALMRMSSVFSKKISLTIGALGIILFALMVGADATVVRASIMALLVLVARALNRPSEGIRLLAFACALMVLQNPLILANDPSFILSFLAAFGLLTFANGFENRLLFIPTSFGMRTILSATLATQLFLLPALIFYTGQVSLVSLPANLLALPLIPPAMFFGFITSILGLIHPWLALPAMIPAWGLLSLVVGIAKSAAAIPGAALAVGGLQTPYIFLLYALLTPLALYSYGRVKQYTKRHL